MRVLYSNSTMSSTTATTDNNNINNNNNEKDPSIPKIPRGLRGLPASSTVARPSAAFEMSQLEQEAAAIERWWSDGSRWQHTKRVYSGTYGVVKAAPQK
jgi:hypothetical protein